MASARKPATSGSARPGVAEDGSIYVKLAGKQVVDQGFTLYAVEDDKAGA